MTDTTPTTAPAPTGTSSTSGRPGLAGLSLPDLPGTNPHDGERPLWWLYTNEFAASLMSSGVRGVGADPADLSAADQKTLASALQVIRSARRQFKDPDPKTALEGAFNLIKVVSYLTGLLSGKPWLPQPSALVPMVKTTADPAGLEAQLDALEQALDALTAPTRGLLGLAFGPQLIVIGVLGVGLGLTIKYAASQMPDTVPD